MDHGRRFRPLKPPERGSLVALAAYAVITLVLVPIGRSIEVLPAHCWGHKTLPCALIWIGIPVDWTGSRVGSTPGLPILLMGAFAWFFAGALVAKVAARLSPRTLALLAVAVGTLIAAVVWLRPEDPRERCQARLGSYALDGAFRPYCRDDLPQIRSLFVAYAAEWSTINEDAAQIGFKPEPPRPRDLPQYRYDLSADRRGGFLFLCTANLDDDPDLEAWMMTDGQGKPTWLFDDCSGWGDRQAFARALLAARDAKSATPVLTYLSDKETAVRRGAVVVLGSLRDPSAVGPLAGLLKDPDVEMRARTATALGQIGGERTRAALTVALDDQEESVRRAAVDALMQLGADKPP